MAPATLQTYVRAQPFRPFRIVLNSGSAYEVRHPEMVYVGKDFFQWFPNAAPGQFPETWETVSLLLVEKVQHLEQAAKVQ